MKNTIEKKLLSFWIHFAIFQLQENKLETFRFIFLFQLQLYFFRWNCFCEMFKYIWPCLTAKIGPKKNSKVFDTWKLKKWEAKKKKMWNLNIWFESVKKRFEWKKIRSEWKNNNLKNTTESFLNTFCYNWKFFEYI